jgi:hypothetical protein
MIGVNTRTEQWDIMDAYRAGAPLEVLSPQLTWVPRPRGAKEPVFSRFTYRIAADAPACGAAPARLANTLDEQIEILTAFRDGKHLQFWDIFDARWVTRLPRAAAPDFSKDVYRVKPERRKFFLVVAESGRAMYGSESERQAEDWASRKRAMFPNATIVPTVEITE